VLQTILLVEGDEVVRDQRVHQLLRAGHIVLTAADAADAVATLRHFVGPIDAVIAGAEMPGVAAVRPGTPVLVVSGDDGLAAPISSA
jgi:CheY-like chemotaxis protein